MHAGSSDGAATNRARPTLRPVVTLTANPDTLVLNGPAVGRHRRGDRDASGGPLANLRVHLDLVTGGIVSACGRLSLTDVTTASDGRAGVVFTAPTLPLPLARVRQCERAASRLSPRRWARMRRSANSFSASIRFLTPTSTNTACGLRGELRDLAESRRRRAAWSRSATPAACRPGHAISNSGFRWSWSDGATKIGPSVTHDFGAAGTYVVTLTITDDIGQSGSKSALHHRELTSSIRSIDMAENSRIDDLRRRVQKDPASIAFAQLAEECRRAGRISGGGRYVPRRPRDPSGLSVGARHARTRARRARSARRGAGRVVAGARRARRKIWPPSADSPRSTTAAATSLRRWRNTGPRCCSPATIPISRRRSPICRVRSSRRSRPRSGGLTMDHMQEELLKHAPPPQQPPAVTVGPAPDRHPPAAMLASDRSRRSAESRQLSRPRRARPAASSRLRERRLTLVRRPHWRRTPAPSVVRWTPSPDDRATRTVAALEQWLAAIHVARADATALKRRHQAIRAALAEQHLDALVVTSLPNILYLTNFTGSSAIVILTADRLEFLTDFRYVTAIERAAARVSRARADAGRRLLRRDARAASRQRSPLARVGFEAAHLTVARHAWLTATLLGSRAGRRRARRDRRHRRTRARAEGRLRDRDAARGGAPAVGGRGRRARRRARGHDRARTRAGHRLAHPAGRIQPHGVRDDRRQRTERARCRTRTPASED